MHIGNMELGLLGANGIVGGGPAIAHRRRVLAEIQENEETSRSRSSATALERRLVHEAANMAGCTSCRRFGCENNGTASSRRSGITGDRRVRDRAAGYGCRLVVDGMDAIAVYEAAARSYRTSP
jgi:pyruvate dehydrogenase E1 component alpha subunit